MNKQESIVKPEFRGPEIPGARLVFIPFLPFPGLISEIKKLATLTRSIHSSQLFYLKKKAVLYGPIGAPASISSLEKIRLLGVKEIILLSYCGSLSEDLRIGQAFIPVSALSDEGTSRHYLARKNKFYYPARESLLNLKSYLERNDLSYTVGSIVSTDAPYRETPSWMKKMQKKGIRAVDMEASAVFAFSDFYGIKTAGLFIVTDELFSGCWLNGLRSQPVHETTRKYFLPLIFDDSF